MFQIVYNHIIQSFLKDGKLDWGAVSYSLSMPIGLISCFASISLGISLLKNVQGFHLSDMKIPFLLMLMFACKIPYVIDKPVALVSFSLNSLGWLIAFLIFVIVYFKSKKINNLSEYSS